MNKKVIVLGGGVAGMSAAHELIERNFDVEVYEFKSIAGGKARSIDVLHPEPPPWGSGNILKSTEASNNSLPGQHGFRYFPGFYKHILDTLKRIPYGKNNKCVFDNLIPATEIGFTHFGKAPIILNTKVNARLKELKEEYFTTFGSEIGIPRKESRFFAKRIWELMTSCEKRRLMEYEQLSWWEFLEADSKSEEFKKIFVHGLPRSLVAARADVASTHTFGNIFLQLLFNILTPSIDVDRLLNGPTNDVWINPWLKYLMDSGVDYHLNAEVIKINCSNNTITSATIKEDGKIFDIKGDYYIAALPVEVMAALTTEELIKADPMFNGIKKLAKNVVWTNGMQIYLRRNVKFVHGHLNHLDSNWALTSLFPRQFWSDDFDFSEYGNGNVKGIISVVISDWNAKGLNEKKAIECTKDEIFEEVWKELKLSMIENGNEILKDEDVHSYYLDEDIIFENGPNDPNPAKKKNTEPLLVNLVNTWDLRPTAHTQIPNFFLASDYVRTNTDLATMEAANEAARRAVNSILNYAGSNEPQCRIWKFNEPEFLAFWQEQDHKRFAKGLPWKKNLSPLIFLSHRFWHHFFRFVFRRIRIKFHK